MSYLSQPTSKTEYGLAVVGDYINVTPEGIISIGQDVSPTATVTFATLSAGSVFSNGQLAVTRVIPSSGAGIALSSVVTTGSTATFTVSNTGVLSLSTGNGVSINTSTGNVLVANTGVLSLSAGSGITISTATGNVLITATGADLINVIRVTANYTATLNDEYIGVFSATATTITLPSGVNGRVYTIKDEYGQGSGKITIQPQTGEKIDNANSYTISVPYQSVSIVYRGTGWWIM